MNWSRVLGQSMVSSYCKDCRGRVVGWEGLIRNSSHKGKVSYVPIFLGGGPTPKPINFGPPTNTEASCLMVLRDDPCTQGCGFRVYGLGLRVGNWYQNEQQV